MQAINQVNPAKRLFLALWPDHGVRGELQHCAQKLMSKQGRAVPAGNLHITLVFLGNVDAAQQKCLVAACEQIAFEPFELQIDRAGHWPRPRVLWLAPEQWPSALLRLVEEAVERVSECGLNPDLRPYHPHITIARKLRQWSGNARIKAVHWSVDRFALVESITAQEGAQYHVLKSWPNRPMI